MAAISAVFALPIVVDLVRYWPGQFGEYLEFPGMGPHPGEVKLLAPAGSLILFNSASLWHSGTLNYSPGLRLAVTTYLSTSATAPPA